MLASATTPKDFILLLIDGIGCEGEDLRNADACVVGYLYNERHSCSENEHAFIAVVSLSLSCFVQDERTTNKLF